MSSPDLTWSQGINQDASINFIDNSTAMFLSGQNLCFIDATNKKRRATFTMPSINCSLIAAHPCDRLFAMAESNVINPRILVYNYPMFEEISVLEGSAILEIITLEFSYSNYLAALSGRPDFKLSIWNFERKQLIATYDLEIQTPLSLSFNPTKWRQIITVHESTVDLYTVEDCADLFMIKKKHLKMPARTMPASTIISAVQDDARTTLSRSVSRMIKYDFELPPSAIAGVDNKYYQEFLETQDRVDRCLISGHTWCPEQILYLACSTGQLIKLDMESMTIRMIYNVEDEAIDAETTRELMGSSGSAHFTAVIFSKGGVYVGDDHGLLRRFELQAAAGNTKTPAVNLTGSFIECHQMPVGQSISQLKFNYAFTALLVACNSVGQIDVLSVDEFDTEPITLIDCGGSSPIVGSDILSPGHGFCVSQRENGLFQIWNMESAELKSSLQIPIEKSAYTLAVNPNLPCAAVAYDDGYVALLDCTDVNRPRFVQKIRLHSSRIRKLKFDLYCQILVTAADDGNLAIMSAYPRTTEFEVLGTIAISGSIVDMDILHVKTESRIQIVVTTATASSSPSGPGIAASPPSFSFNNSSGANSIYYVDIKQSVLDDPASHFQSIEGNFRDDAVGRMSFNFASASFGCALMPSSLATPLIYVVQANTRRLCCIQIPDEPPKKAGNKASFLVPQEEFPNFQFDDPNVSLQISNNAAMIAGYGTEGRLILMNLADKEAFYSAQLHSLVANGCSQISFNQDSSLIISSGFDGSIKCIDLHLSEAAQKVGKDKFERIQSTIEKNQLERYKKALSEMSELEIQLVRPETAQVEDAGQTNTDDGAPAENEHASREGSQLVVSSRSDGSIHSQDSNQQPDAVEKTWSQQRVREHLYEEDRQYTEVKTTLKKRLAEIRKTIRNMVDENESVPELEKINRQELELDTENQNHMLHQTNQIIQSVRDEIELDDLSKQFTHDVLKKMCWDEMNVVKGRSICGFLSNIEVTNFPLKQVSKEDQEHLEMIKRRRRVEIAEASEYRTQIENYQKGNLMDAPEETDEQEEDGTRKESPSLFGGSAINYGIKADLLYNQMELETRDQKMNQIVMINDIIRQVKEAFNREFQEVYAKKETELNRIKDKNTRITKILIDLAQEDQIQPHPELNDREMPEKLLVVSDAEITVEKYLSEEERARLEQERAAEEERKRLELLDNWRERGLDEMMGGVLEVKKEDELKKDVPKPAFLVQNKPEDEWSEDERKQFAEYEAKVKELNEEREKFRKQLESEYKKLSGFIEEGKLAFDEALLALFNRRLRMQSAIYQEQIKVLRLKWSLMLGEEFNAREFEILQMMDEIAKNKSLMMSYIQNSKVILDQSQEEYDNMMAEEKLLEKNIRKHFTDVTSSATMEALLKAYKRRPRRGAGGLLQHQMAAAAAASDKPSGSASASGGAGLDASISSNAAAAAARHNPYLTRPASARLQKMQMQALEAGLRELDREMPPHAEFDADVWHRLCEHRLKKARKELDIKVKANQIADINQFLQDRIEEEHGLESQLYQLQGLQEELKNEKSRFFMDKELQLLMKQGQVELELELGAGATSSNACASALQQAGSNGMGIHEFSEALLVNRAAIEDLNAQIRALGETKVQHMIRGTELKKKFVHLEWELRRMLMEYEDLEKKMKEVQSFKITKEIQRFLSTNDYEALINEEISKLEQTISTLKEHHEHHISSKKDRFKNIRTHKLQKIARDNAELGTELEDLNVSFHERKFISENQATKEGERRAAEQRYQKILQRQKLVDLAKAQAREVAVLRAEVERLRMRTFPALVQHR